MTLPNTPSEYAGHTGWKIAVVWKYPRDLSYFRQAALEVLAAVG